MQHGLMKPTRFDLADVNRLDLEWSDKWFTVPRSQPKIVIGKLSDASIERLKVILAWRKKNNRTD
jgi:hypothetical protein